MSSRLFRPLLGALATVVWLGCAASQPAPMVEIHIDRGVDGQLRISYLPPPGVNALRFVDGSPRTHQLFRAPMLKPLHACARLSATGIERDAPDCVLSFTVRPARLGQWAFYEPAQPASDGVLVFTRYLAATAPGAGLAWRIGFDSPQQKVVAGGEVRDAYARDVPASAVAALSAELPVLAQNERLLANHYLFIGRAEERRGDGYLLLRDERVPPWVAAHVQAILRTALAGYATGFGRNIDHRVSLFLLADVAQPGQAGQPGFHGDLSSGQAIRLYFGQPPQQPDPAFALRVSEFLAHELAHLWNAGLFNSDGELTWIHEGGAEWLSATLLDRAQLVAAERLPQRLQGALERCVFRHAHEPWATAQRNRGPEAYACGMLIHALTFAAARQQQPTLAPLPAAGVLYRLRPSVNVSAFVEMAGGGVGGRALSTLLTSETVPMSTSLPGVLRALGIEFHEVDATEVPDGALRVAHALMQAIGKRNCDRFAGYWTRDGYFEMDEANQCAALPKRTEVERVAGVTLLAYPAAARAALEDACASAPNFVLGLRGGSEIELRCAKLDFPRSIPRIRGQDWRGLIEALPR